MFHRIATGTTTVGDVALAWFYIICGFVGGIAIGAFVA